MFANFCKKPMTYPLASSIVEVYKDESKYWVKWAITVIVFASFDMRLFIISANDWLSHGRQFKTAVSVGYNSKLVI